MATCLKSPELFSVFWLISTIMLFVLSWYVPRYPTLPGTYFSKPANYHCNHRHPQISRVSFTGVLMATSLRLPDYSSYSGRSQQYCCLYCIHSSLDLQLFQPTYSSNPVNYNCYHRHPHIIRGSFTGILVARSFRVLDYSRYSGRSQQCCCLYCIHSSLDIHLF